MFPPKNLIVCAAIRNSRGHIICGVRHYDTIMHGQARNRNIWKPGSGIEQGFVDRNGQFHSRRDAWVIALAAGQVQPGSPNKGILYSEDLY